MILRVTRAAGSNRTTPEVLLKLADSKLVRMTALTDTSI